MNSIALPRQTNVSESIRVSIKRLACQNGGLAQFMRDLGQPYKRMWERVNRNRGDLIDGVVGLAQTGFDEPLRIAADAAGYEVIPKMRFLRTNHPPKPVRSYGLDMHYATTMITHVLDEALADQRIDDKELEKLKGRIHEARKSLAAFEAKIAGILP